MNHMIKIIAMCVVAALICTTIRGIHPHIATAIAFAGGAAVLLLSLPDIAALSDMIRKLNQLTGEKEQMHILKVCGIAMIAELASDICRDGGEASIANRIDICTRIGITAAAIPYLSTIVENSLDLLS